MPPSMPLPKPFVATSFPRTAGLFAAVCAASVLAAGLAPAPLTAQAGWTLVAWNDLGMHCMDSDYSVFSVLPPYNTIHAQLIDASGEIVGDPSGITVTYEAVADPSGSINTSSAAKTNFWSFVTGLFGASPPPDDGLAGFDMPGPANTPQPMTWQPAGRWFTAEGIPITPYDDAGRKNPYPMMRLVARNRAGTVLAATEVVLPVSDEMTCSACHASGSGAAARPAAGWVFEADPERDYRLNILRLHDDKQGGTPAFQGALTQAGYSAAGLFPTAHDQGRPILCAACHGSNALPGTGVSGVPPLTRSVHAFHANVVDPTNGMTLEASANRTSCYRCHPGSETRCLRGAMGHAVAPDGALALECQSCHGSMRAVGAAARLGWLEEPTCQSCHTGTATHNSGQIRYTSVFDATGAVRQAADLTFATQANAPSAGLSLFRFSYGHGGLACEACHGSTHAVYPSSHLNDNVQSQQIQGHLGTLAECAACHGTVPSTVSGGPHGLHPLGPSWVHDHSDVAEDGNAGACRACHGTDFRGTVLSTSQADWTVNTEDFGTKTFWRGFRIGCYACHNGPGSEERNPNRPAQVSDASASTRVGRAVAIPLAASDPDGNLLTLRIVSQPPHGRVGLSGRTATYHPDPTFAGNDAFTFAAWDGATDSNLGRVTVAVTGTVPTDDPPAAPSELTARAVSTTEILLGWRDNSTREDRFQIESRAGSAGFAEIAAVGPNVTSFTAHGLTPATPYTFRVRASNEHGSSAYSNEAAAATFAVTGPCVPDATTLCLDDTPGDRRFRVTVAYQTTLGGGAQGLGMAIALAPVGVERGGLFWFFDAKNPELLVKVLPACQAPFERYWIFWSAGTNVGLTVTVTDTATGAVRVYTNPDRHAAVPVQDTDAFLCGP